MILDNRFWSKVISRDEGCWEWAGANNGKGYGKLMVASKYYYVHRLSYEAHVGPIPIGLFVCHSCDNRKCVNPLHLFLGTAKDNTADMYTKNRQVHKVKLSAQEVLMIKKLHSTAKLRQYELAKRFNVNQSQISRIIGGKRRKNVEI